MAEKLDPKELVTLEELALSNMWETAALGRGWNGTALGGRDAAMATNYIEWRTGMTKPSRQEVLCARS